MRISDWSSDVCSSDLRGSPCARQPPVSRSEKPPCTRRWKAHDTAADQELVGAGYRGLDRSGQGVRPPRSEEHTSELQSLMRISYAVFCLKKKTSSYPFFFLFQYSFSFHLYSHYYIIYFILYLIFIT